MSETDEINEVNESVYLIASDKSKHPVSREAALLSPTLKPMLGSFYKESKGEIELPEMSADVVGKVAEYLEYKLKYKDTDVDPENAPAFDVPTELSLELLIAADYLNI